jgi:pyruvate,orthophosphate dikinase
VHGSRTAHAAVVARQLGKPCLVGCAQLAIDIAARSIALGGQTLHEGDSLWIDAEAGLVFTREPAVAIEKPEAELAAVAAWRRDETHQRASRTKEPPRAGMAAVAP